MSAVPTPGTTIACQDLVELVTDYLEDALEPAAQVELEAHLALCSGCAAYLEQLRETIRELGRVRVEGLGDKAWGELMAAFRTLHRDRTPARRGHPHDD